MHLHQAIRTQIGRFIVILFGECGKHTAKLPALCQLKRVPCVYKRAYRLSAARPDKIIFCGDERKHLTLSEIVQEEILVLAHKEKKRPSPGVHLAPYPARLIMPTQASFSSFRKGACDYHLPDLFRSKFGVYRKDKPCQAAHMRGGHTCSCRKLITRGRLGDTAIYRITRRRDPHHIAVV